MGIGKGIVELDVKERNLKYQHLIVRHLFILVEPIIPSRIYFSIFTFMSRTS